MSAQRSKVGKPFPSASKANERKVNGGAGAGDESSSSLHDPKSSILDGSCSPSRHGAGRKSSELVLSFELVDEALETTVGRVLAPGTESRRGESNP